MTTSERGGSVGPQIASLFVQNGPSSQPVDRRDRGFGSRGEHDPVGLDLRAVRELDPMGTDQAGLLHEDADARSFERRGALPGLGVDDVARPLLDGGKVHGHRRDADAESAGVPGERRDLRAPQHDLRGHAPVVVAFAAEPVAFGDGDAHALLTQAERHLGAGPAATDHEDVEAVHPHLARAPRNPTKIRA